jgi:calmodulin
MGAGGSTPGTLPATEEAAIAAGYTHEQIKAHKEKPKDPDGFSKEQIAKFKQAFSLYDKDGSITAKDLGKVFLSINEPKTEAELADMTNDYDDEGNAIIDYSEFLTVMKLRMQNRSDEEDTNRAFQELSEGRAYVCPEDIIRANPTFTEAEALELVREADHDGDGQLNYEEHANMNISK